MDPIVVLLILGFAIRTSVFNVDNFKDLFGFFSIGALILGIIAFLHNNPLLCAGLFVIYGIYLFANTRK